MYLRDVIAHKMKGFENLLVYHKKAKKEKENEQ